MSSLLYPKQADRTTQQNHLALEPFQDANLEWEILLLPQGWGWRVFANCFEGIGEQKD
jgi:hypothetical protein